MLIVPDDIREHLNHGCEIAGWAIAARMIFAEKLEIKSSEIYLTVAAEVTSGHLLNHAGKICVMTVSSTWVIGITGEDIVKPIFGLWKQAADLTSTVFPSTINRLIEEGRPFDVVVVENPNSFALAEVDLEASRRSGSVTVRKIMGRGARPTP
jgi:hypothetical protein